MFFLNFRNIYIFRCLNSKSDIKKNYVLRKMSNFDIDEEIDKAVDKLADQLKTRLKKLVVRSEKQVLRQYIASQKETARAAKTKTSTTGRSRDNTGPRGRKVAKKAPAGRRAPKREKDYKSGSESDYSDSDSE